jgi:UDP-N-acetylmuramate--alanine ligase
MILNDTKNYCICAAHGKSTTTAILSSILQSTAIIGAISKEFDSNFRYVDDIVAFESDESDESFINSNPYCSIVINTEVEHLEYYDYDEDRFYGAYKKFLDIAQIRVINAEDEFLSTINLENTIKLYPSKDIKNVEFFFKNDEPCTRFSLKDFGVFEVWGFGEHTAVNCSLAILAGHISMSISDIRTNLLKYKGIKKRFDIVQKSDDFVIIDDYAHHPTEIRATIEAIELYKSKKSFDKTTVIWQPHKYSRTRDNLEEFKKCFKGCDELIILPVWSVKEEILDIDFANDFAHYNTIFADKVQTTNGQLEILLDNKVIKSYQKGMIVGVGAGDITYQLRY